jgi:hypothetical protein
MIEFFQSNLPMIWILAILFIHFISDFVCQPHEIATNKWHSFSYLLAHASQYLICIYALTSVFFIVPALIYKTTIYTDLIAMKLIWFAIINGFLHGFVDFFESKFTHYFYDKKDFHNFFVVIGFCQFLHMAGMLMTADYFFNIL